MLSVIIIAKNEASRIRRCLDSVTWVDEVIVLDSGSEDDTVAIAQTYTRHVFQTDWQGFGVQKQRALQYATGDWVLNLDADEWVDECLRTAIVAAMAAGDHDGYRVPIRMQFYNQSLRFSAGPKRHIRLFKRKGAAFSADLVHEKIQLPAGARIGRITAPILHDSFRDMTHAIDKMNLYSSYSAQIRIQNNKRHGLFKTLLSSCWMFVRCYVVQGGFLDGRAGIIFALFHAHGSWYRGVKQLYRDQSL